MVSFKYISNAFKKPFDFKSKANRLEFFTGLISSAFFLALNVFILIQLNSYFAYFRSDTLTIITLIYSFITVLFTFIQSHSLLARRLNDISVIPYFSFIPFLLASSYLIFKSFFNIDSYGKLIFICILSVISICITLMVSESD